jgi:hypothetical protein
MCGQYVCAGLSRLLDITSVTVDRMIDAGSSVVDAIENVRGDALPHVPRLVRGTDGALWALLERAYRDGLISRVGLVFTLLSLPENLQPTMLPW